MRTIVPSIRSKNLSLFICSILHGLTHAFQLILPPLYLSIKDDLGIDRLSGVMLLVTIYFVTYAVMNLPYGILGDHFSKKKILVFGATLNSLAFLLAAGTSSYTVFMVAMILAGLGGGTYHPVANALISNLFKGMVGRAFGLIGMGASLGLFFGPYASGFIGERFGWRISCLFFAVFGCLVAVSFALIMPEEEKKSTRLAALSLSWRSLIIPMIPVILIFGMRDFCLWGMASLTPVMTQVNLNFTEETAGILIGLMSLMGVVSQPLGGFISDHVGRRRVIFVTLLLGGISVIFYPHLDGATIFPVALFAGFLLLGTVPVIDAVAAEIMPPSIRGRMFGVMMTMGIMFGAVSPYITGLIVDVLGEYTRAYQLLGLIGALGALVVFFIPSKRPY